jgi:hypothetical protein
MKRLFIILVCLIPLFTGCEKKSDPLPAKVAPEQKAPAKVATPETVTPPLTSKRLLQEGIEATLVEVPTQALPIWRQYREQKPTLVLYSRDPFLARTPAALEEESIELVQNGAPDKLATRLLFPSSNPLLLPDMALDSALRAGLFSRVVWVFPAKVPIDKLEGEVIPQQLLELGAIDQDEAQTFVYAEGVASGIVQGLPFNAVHPEALPTLQGPVVLHIDLSFFQPLYKGEIKTPLYPLLYKTMSDIAKLDWQGVCATLSYSNISSGLPLATRFIGPTLASLLREPGLLDAQLPANWARRDKTLYLPNFFKTEEINKLYQEMDSAEPEDASIKFGHYQVSRQLKDGTRALDLLAQAVALDPVYGLEYPDLSSVAMEKGRPLEAVKMLRLATAALPDNPFLALRLASFLIQNGHPEQAINLLTDLDTLPWSETYFPEMSAQLVALISAAKESGTVTE